MDDDEREVTGGVGDLGLGDIGTGWEPLPSAPVRRLKRSRNDRMLFGVCGGVANYFGVDSTLVRLAFLLLLLGAGSGVLFYLAAWLVIPDGGPGDGAGARTTRLFGIDSPSAMLGLALVVIGVVFLLHVALPSIVTKAIVPIMLIGLGIAIVVRGRRER
jgi:phage shock protein C